MPCLGRVRARLLLALKSLPTHLGKYNTRPCINVPQRKQQSKGLNTHFALQIKSRSVRVRAFRAQLRRKRTQCLDYAPALHRSARGDNARAEFLWRVRRRGKHRGVVVDPRIYEQHAALRVWRATACARARARSVVVGAEPVDAPGLDVDARDLGSVVCCEYRELNRAAPGVRGENCADVFVAWMPSSLSSGELGSQAIVIVRQNVWSSIETEDAVGRTLG